MLASFNRHFVRFLLLITAVYWRAIYLDFRRRYEVSPGFRFNGKNILLYGNGRIVLGECSYIGDNSTVQASAGCAVIVGWVAIFPRMFGYLPSQCAQIVICA